MSYKCLHCTKRFKSKSGLRRHKIAQHPFDPPIADVAAPHEEPVADVQDADDLMAERDVITASLAQHMAKGDPVRAAMKALGITRENVMAYKVYPDKVVIIEGPVGWKRTWERDAS